MTHSGDALHTGAAAQTQHWAVCSARRHALDKTSLNAVCVLGAPEAAQLLTPKALLAEQDSPCCPPAGSRLNKQVSLYKQSQKPRPAAKRL